MINFENLDLIEIEKIAYKKPDSLEKQYLGELIMVVRHLQHQLDDPNYMFSTGRITRAAVICRNATIDELRVENQALRDEIVKLQKMLHPEGVNIK